jgi:hypothetical protein
VPLLGQFYSVFQRNGFAQLRNVCAAQWVFIILGGSGHGALLWFVVGGRSDLRRRDARRMSKKTQITVYKNSKTV